MQINPHLNHSQLPVWQLTSQKSAVLYGNRRTIALIADVYMWGMMLFCNFGTGSVQLLV